MEIVPQINILVPLFNEEDSFETLVNRLSKLMDDSGSLRISVIMADDGSTDRTPELMEALSLRDHRFHSIFLSRNFGHQMALSALLSCSDASECAFIIDGDLQDPPELLHEFYRHFQQGYDVVYAVRSHRKESIFKRTAYKSFYRVLKNSSYIDIPLDSGDFSLISRRVIDELNNMGEESRFIRGMRSWVGFRQLGIPYKREERKAGDSKYTFPKLLQLAFNGIFNFSQLPIRLISYVGATTVFISLCYLAHTIIKRLFFDEVPEGFTGIIATITLFGGAQLLSIGIIGEYILRIFFQVKQRPLFIIKKQIKDRQETTHRAM